MKLQAVDYNFTYKNNQRTSKSNVKTRQQSFGMKFSLNGQELLNAIKSDDCVDIAANAAKIVPGINKNLDRDIINNAYKKFKLIRKRAFYNEAWEQVFGVKAPDRKVKASVITKMFIPNLEEAVVPIKLNLVAIGKKECHSFASFPGHISASIAGESFHEPVLPEDFVQALKHGKRKNVINHIVDTSNLEKLLTTMSNMEKNAKDLEKTNTLNQIRNSNFS